MVEEQIETEEIDKEESEEDTLQEEGAFSVRGTRVGFDSQYGLL